ncbi:hypothetical protein [Wohlfahrtiimonas larvae]|uniref:Uncharacterized protein n=1 Tax=Wohlfahrtiimonas larvae TaxID=1157986 RepID=A0ABP9MW52_9GAMM|nr:hypothetical protein [Wohlfahrtiimonas larvae]
MKKLDVCPTWEDFESLFLEFESEDERDQKIEDYENDFTFSVDGGCTLTGAFSEGFPEALEVEELIDEDTIDWATLDAGTPFMINYQGKQLQCYESGFEDDEEEAFYYEGITALSNLLLELGLVLKQFVPTGIGSDLVFALIPLEIWNKGLETFGLDELREIFVDFGDPKIFEYLMEE